MAENEVKDNKKPLERIKGEIDKIVNKQSNIFFFVLDTKGNPNGSLEYIYKLAYILKEDGYHVKMLYQVEKDDEFEGVESWLGEKYAKMEHYDITSGEIGVSPSDLLFIPELFSNVLMQTKDLPCKRIVILQNYDYILEQMPMSSGWGNVGVLDCITNTDINASLVKEIFPYVKTVTINPYIDSIYGETSEPKKLVVNIISKNQEDINKIIKPFYWKYPMYKWVSFRDVRGFPKEKYAEMLREAVATVYVDENTSFGYGALEALKSGSIVLAKSTELTQKWMEVDGKLSNCCVWFDTFHEVHRLIASVIRAYITDNVPDDLKECSEKALSNYSYDKTKEEILNYVQGMLGNRKKEMENLFNMIEKNGK